MTLIDSVDSIVMLYSYAGFPEHKFALLEDATADTLPAPGTPTTPAAFDSAPASPIAKTPPMSTTVLVAPPSPRTKTPSPAASLQALPLRDAAMQKALADDADARDEVRARQLRVKRNAMSGLSIVLTLMSILVAFTCVSPLRPASAVLTPRRRISLITIMGLIGDNCTPCQNAANAPDGGGLAGRWWRGWAAVCSAFSPLQDCPGLKVHFLCRRTTNRATLARQSWVRSSQSSQRRTAGGTRGASGGRGGCRYNGADLEGGCRLNSGCVMD